MDLYRNIIPNKKGETIQQLVRKRNEIGNGERSQSKRPKVRAGHLKPAEGGEQEFEDEEVIKPEDDLGKYDHKCLQEGLGKMKGVAKRKILPRTKEFVNMHINAYETALYDETRREASVAVVPALDRVYFSAAFLLKPRQPDEHEFLRIIYN